MPTTGFENCLQPNSLAGILRFVSSQSANETSLRCLFPNHIDHYKGIHFDLSSAKVDQDRVSVARFGQLLKQEIDYSQEAKDSALKAIWFRVSRDNWSYVEPMIKLDFDLHHTKHNRLDLVKSLSTRSNIPKYAFTNVGVGGLVVSERNEVLVVKEKNYLLSQHWKLPGGYAEQGEEIDATAVREVFEETGVKTQFECLLLMRHVHKFAFDCSDFYFICLLRPLTFDITNCQHEIHDCRWTPIDQIRNELTNLNRVAIDKYLQYCQNPVAIRKEVLKTNFALLPEYSVYSNFRK